MTDEETCAQLYREPCDASMRKDVAETLVAGAPHQFVQSVGLEHRE
jgi:hypothetical protein